jgi:hypothetical protein
MRRKQTEEDYDRLKEEGRLSRQYRLSKLVDDFEEMENEEKMTREEAAKLMDKMQAEACCPLHAAEVCPKCRRKKEIWQAAKVWLNYKEG